MIVIQLDSVATQHNLAYNGAIQADLHMISDTCGGSLV
jgi:hypothetical protein